MKYTILLLAITSLVSFACKTQNTISEKIEGKWQVERYFSKTRLLTMEDTVSRIGSSDDIMDFRKDGNIYLSNPPGKDIVLPYKVEGDSILVLGADRFTITNLTDKSMKLYSKKTDKYTPVVFTEMSYAFKR